MKQLTALQILNSGANVFLTGSAGAGKSYTTTQFIKAAQSKGLKVAVSASTGRSVANSISTATGGKISYIKDNIVVDVVVDGARFFVLYNATYDVWNIKVAKSGGK